MYIKVKEGIDAVLRSFENGAKNGRSGKGSIYLAPGGNSGAAQSSCTLDEIVNSIHTITINGMGASGSKPIYGEECPGT